MVYAGLLAIFGFFFGFGIFGGSKNVDWLFFVTSNVSCHQNNAPKKMRISLQMNLTHHHSFLLPRHLESDKAPSTK
jgi:hypothetical protein